MLVLCLTFLAITPVALPLALSARGDEGEFGTFTADHEVCSRSSCAWRGTFVSDDGRTRLDDTDFDGDGLEQRGDQARAQKVDGDESLYEPGDKSWHAIALGDVGCAAYVAWWLWARRWRGTRAEQRPDAAPSG